MRPRPSTPHPELCAPGRPATVALRPEPEEVLASGRQPVRLDVHAVCPGRVRDRVPASYNARERRILGDLPVHDDLAARHATQPVALQWLGRKPGPEHHAGRPRVTRRHAERERLAHGPEAPGPLGRVIRAKVRKTGTEDGGGEATEEGASRDGDHVP